MTANPGKMLRTRFFLIVLASTVFAILLHQLHHDPLMTLSTMTRSGIITSGYFPPVAFASLALAFGILGWTFLAIQQTLRGSGLFKGTRFGIALGGMYLVGMMEAYVVYPVPLFGEFYTGMVDGCGILLMSLMLGKYLAEEGPAVSRMAYQAFPAILIIPVIYVLARYFSYTLFQIESSYTTRPLATFLWTIGMGYWIGIMYLLVGRSAWHGNPVKRALVFGGLVFGINWLIFNLFVLLFIKVPLSDLLFRSLFDSVAIIAGVYLSSSRIGGSQSS